MHSQRRRWEREKGVTQERHDMHSQRRRWEREKDWLIDIFSL
jgi:hypothetical protein